MAGAASSPGMFLLPTVGQVRARGHRVPEAASPLRLGQHWTKAQRAFAPELTIPKQVMQPLLALGACKSPGAGPKGQLCLSWHREHAQ